MNTKGLLAVLHQVIDLLGGGAQHLHADLDAAAGIESAAAAPAPLTDAEQASLAALEARAAAVKAYADNAAAAQAPAEQTDATA